MTTLQLTNNSWPIYIYLLFVLETLHKQFTKNLKVDFNLYLVGAFFVYYSNLNEYFHFYIS